MPNRSFVQRLQRFCYHDATIDADSPQEATLGAIQTAITGVIPDEEWNLPPCMANTVRAVGQPREIPYQPLYDGDLPPKQQTIDDLPDGAEVPEELLEGLASDGDIVEDVEATDALSGGEMPDISEEMLDYLHAEDEVDLKRQQGIAITDEEYAALRETRQMLIQALTPVETDGDIVEAPMNDPSQPQLPG